MQELSVESINQAIQLCQQNENYRVLVYVQYDQDRADIAWPIMQEGINNIQVYKNKYRMIFPNGSQIIVIGPSTNKCGVRANLVLYDSRVSGDAVTMAVLRCFEANNKDFKLAAEEI